MLTHKNFPAKPCEKTAAIAIHLVSVFSCYSVVSCLRAGRLPSPQTGKSRILHTSGMSFYCKPSCMFSPQKCREKTSPPPPPPPPLRCLEKRDFHWRNSVVSPKCQCWKGGLAGGRAHWVYSLPSHRFQPDVIHETKGKKKNELGVALSLWSLIVSPRTIKPCHVGSFPRLRALRGPEALLCHPQISTLTCLRVGSNAGPPCANINRLLRPRLFILRPLFFSAQSLICSQRQTPSPCPWSKTSYPLHLQ